MHTLKLTLSGQLFYLKKMRLSICNLTIHHHPLNTGLGHRFFTSRDSIRLTVYNLGPRFRQYHHSHIFIFPFTFFVVFILFSSAAFLFNSLL